jgi:hypothetical protein
MIQVIDNAISLEQQNVIEKLCSSVEFPWYFQENTTYHKDDIKKYNLSEEFFKDSIDGPFLAHLVQENGIVNSVFFDTFLPLYFAIPGYKDTNLVRLKVNLTYPLVKSTQNTHSDPHVDLSDDVDFRTAIYYINDSDGDTFIFNEKWPHSGAVTLNQRITPKKGRLVVFDGKYLHAGNNPSKGVRLLANINVTSRSTKNGMVSQTAGPSGS